MMVPKVPVYMVAGYLVSCGHRVPFVANHVQAALAESGGRGIS